MINEESSYCVEADEKRILDELRAGRNLRRNLSALREILRKSRGQVRKRESDEHTCADWIRGALEERDWLTLFESEDAKARKNAASLAGDLLRTCRDKAWSDRTGRMLWEAYRKEETLFVRSVYLKALEGGDCSFALGEMQDRLDQLRACACSEETLAHIRAERQALESILSELGAYGGELCWRGISGEEEILLECQPYIRNQLKARVDAISRKPAESRIVPRGLRVRLTAENWEKVLACRIYKDFYIYVPLRKGTRADRRGVAEAICKSGLLDILGRIYCRKEELAEDPSRETSYRFRLSRMKSLKQSDPGTRDCDPGREGDFLRRLATEIEEESRHRLVNVPGNYQLEILLAAKRDGTYAIYLRPSLYQDRRFSYRLHAEPTSMAPYKAAQMIELLSPYLRADHRVIDPLAGVGSLLIERAYRLHILSGRARGGDCYALDTYGQAVAEGRENAVAAGLRVRYINRSFFDFKDEDLFDEILTEAPQMAGGQREEKEYFYRSFFDHAIGILAGTGLIMLLTREGNLVRKQIRLHESLCLREEIPMGERRSIYVIARRS